LTLSAAALRLGDRKGKFIWAWRVCGFKRGLRNRTKKLESLKRVGDLREKRVKKLQYCQWG